MKNPYEFTNQGEVLEPFLAQTDPPEIHIYCRSNNQNVPDGGTVSFSSTAQTKKFFIYNDGQSNLNLGNFYLPAGSGYSM